jgi:glycosyltransferase involved in cell wall biosynthesis
MKFYIVTPVYNGKQHLAACIESVAAQAGNDIYVHHHVQDGGSFDGTEELLRQYEASDPATDYYQFSFESAKDDGMYDAINRGWNKATHDNDWFAWLNADEQYLPGALQKIVTIRGRHSSWNIVAGNCIITDPQGDYVCSRYPSSARLGMGRVRIPAISCAMFLDHWLIQDTRLRFDNRFKVVGDREFLLDALDLKARIGYCNEFLALFIHSGENLGCGVAYLKETRKYDLRRRLSGLQRLCFPVLVFLARLSILLRAKMGRRLNSYFVLDGQGSTRTVQVSKESFRYDAAKHILHTPE